MTLATDILKYINANLESMTGFLKTLVLHESPSKDLESQTTILGVISNELKRLGYFTKYIPGEKTGGYLYARPHKRKKNTPCQLLIGHCDTVWDKHTLKKMPITMKDGTMTGPGVYDMKAGLTQLIFAIRTINALSLPMPVTPLILINSDEEIGSKESTRMIKRLAKISDRAFVLEPPLGLEGKLKTARKGLGRFTITAIGKAAHAGLDPGKGVSAIVEISHQIQQLYAMNDFEKGITVNVGMIEGGISPNVVAPESKAIVDVRVLNRKDGDTITKKIHGLKPSMPNIKLHIEGGIGRPPMERTPRNQKLWQFAKTKASHMGLNLDEAVAGGGSDGNTTSEFTATLDGLGTTGDGAHAAHEFIFLEQLPERTALLTQLIISDTVDNELNKK
ncbi:M20 family metallopeptidase [uncultured Muriicola sp.]|uniref:M20 family metallopeptidase n=1 Tax=uncultured Muriicola sp. TaxID=1583102 RepID=UPI002612538D|nr:M20 family metallopeptidase [uncultured Muriicola sp.]